MTDATDPEAPYGRHPDGTPKRSNGGRPPGTASGKKPTGKSGRTTRRGASSPTRRATPNTAPKKSDPPADFTDSVAGVVSLFGLMTYTKEPLVAAVLFDKAEDLGRATNELAKHDKYVRAACERAAIAGPYGAFAAVLFGTVAQIAEVKGWAPSQLTTAFGAKPRAVFVAEFDAKQRQAADQAGAQMGFGNEAADVPADAFQHAEPPFTRTDYSDRTVA